MFDAQIKRIHEYKRQLLNVMSVIHDYLGIVERGRDAAGAAHLHLCRQGRAGILGRQADHQAHPQRRRRGEQRHEDARPDEGRVSARLSRLAGAADHPCRRLERANLDGRHGGLGHRQHEAVDEWRADHRHLRRRQHRDRRRSGRREHLHLRTARRRNPRDAAEGHLQSATSDTKATPRSRK